VFANIAVTKQQIGITSLSAMPNNKRCGFLSEKVPPFRLSFIGCPPKRENWRHEMWSNVYFKPLSMESLLISELLIIVYNSWPLKMRLQRI